MAGRTIQPEVMEIDGLRINVVRSERRNLALQVRNGCVIARAPFRLQRERIACFVREKRSWIDAALKRAEETRPTAEERYTKEDIERMAEEAVKAIPARVRYFAPIVGVTYGRITIRNQKSKWGSCSSKGNLNFNCLLMEVPPEILDYVVVHELCHRKEMNHSPRFWSEVEKVLPDYRRRKQWLKKNGTELIRRMVG